MIELVYGIHPIKSILEIRPEKILKVHVMRNSRDIRFESLMQQINKNNIHLEKHSRRWFNNKIKGVLHQGIIAEVRKVSSLTEKDLYSIFDTICNSSINLLLLILDGITDPQNLGACLRSAEAAGVHMVIATRHRSASINSTVRKVSSGAADRIPFIRVTNLVRILKFLQERNIWIVGTVIQSCCTIFNSKLIDPLALIMGSEELGVRKLTQKYCNELIHIPMNGSIASLNVSVATGICLFEVLRQRSH